MPAFLGLLTALGPAATGAALAIAPAQPAADPAYAPVPRETCSYVLTFVANGALLTGTCEGTIATWEWRPLQRTIGAREPDEVLTEVPEARGRGPGEAEPGGWNAGEAEVGSGRADGEETDGGGAGEGEKGVGGADTAPDAVPDAVPEALPDAVPEALPDAVPEALPDAVPEALPGTVRAAPEVVRDGRERARKKSGGVRGRLPGQVAVAAALSRLGTPFSWGGGSVAGPTKGIGRGSRISGFDCSGLTLYAWAKAGVKLGHYTGTQFRQGRRVAPGDLRAGDLVFFGGGGGDPTHVGLYLHGGVMIHAPKTGDVVKKTNFVKSPYFGARYRGAVRPSG